MDFTIIEVGDDRHFGYAESAGKWLDSGFMMQAELIGFADQQAVWTELGVTRIMQKILA